MGCAGEVASEHRRGLIEAWRAVARAEGDLQFPRLDSWPGSLQKRRAHPNGVAEAQSMFTRGCTKSTAPPSYRQRQIVCWRTGSDGWLKPSGWRSSSAPCLDNGQFLLSLFDLSNHVELGAQIESLHKGPDLHDCFTLPGFVIERLHVVGFKLTQALGMKTVKNRMASWLLRPLNGSSRRKNDESRCSCSR